MNLQTIIKSKKSFSVRCILLTSYITFVLFSQLYAFCDIGNVIILVALFLVILLGSFLISNILLCFMTKHKFNFILYNSKFNVKHFTINFIIIFVIGMIVYNIKTFTGKLLFEPDFEYAMVQAKNNQYMAFSSPIFILIFAKLPMIIFDNPFFIGTFYILIRSLIVTYIITELSFNRIISIVLIVYYCFLPLSIHSEMTLMKDTPCAIFAAVSVLLIHKYLYFNNNNSVMESLIALFLSLTNFMRPNAVIFSFSMIAMLFFVLKKRTISYLRILIAFIALLIIGNVVVPKIVSIKENDTAWNMVEVMSIPATTVMAVAKYKPESLNSKETEYLKLICGENLEALNDFDDKVGWESVKFNNNIYNRSYLPLSYFDLANYTLDLVIREPSIAIKQIIRSTSSLYGYRYVGKKRKNVLSNIYYFFANIEVGFLFFILIALLIIKCSIFDSSKINILIAIPIILFSVVTSLIIASPAITRYYLPLQMSVPIYIMNILGTK